MMFHVPVYSQHSTLTEALYSLDSIFSLITCYDAVCVWDHVMSPSTVTALQFVSLTDAATPLPMEDDIASERIVPPGGIPIFGQNRTSLFVSIIFYAHVF